MEMFLGLVYVGAGALRSIYSSILTQHLQHGSFANMVVKSCASLVQSAIALHNKVAHTFLPTAVKFHYIFNLRDISNIFQVCKKKSQILYFCDG